MTRSGELTPEQRARHNDRARSRRARWTPEQREHEVEVARARRAARTPEQIQQENARDRKRRSRNKERENARDRERRATKRARELPVLPSTAERKQTRVDAGLNLVEMGKRVGVLASAVSAWEGGVEPRSHRRLRAYAAVLEDLKRTPTPIVDRAIEALEHSWEVVLAVHNGRGWTEEQKVRLRRQVKNIQMSVYKSDVSEGASDG